MEIPLKLFLVILFKFCHFFLQIMSFFCKVTLAVYITCYTDIILHQVFGLIPMHDCDEKILGSMVVKDFFLEAETNSFVIAARPTKTEQCRCSRCHCKAKYYDGGRGARRWRTLDIGSSKAFVEASAPRVCCKKHGVVVANVPWARLNSRFCKAFEEQGLTYANYRVELTAVLLNDNNSVVNGTTSSDYVVYTNAKIETGFINS